MSVIRRALYAELLLAIAATGVAFLSLFFFLDLAAQLPSFSEAEGGAHAALLATLALLPQHVYELLPICALIGSAFVFARLAQSSEFTILRVSGLTPMQALRLLLPLGLALCLLTFAVGDWLLPRADRWVQQSKSGGTLLIGGRGAWLKDRQEDGQGEPISWIVHIQGFALGGALRDVQLFEFDAASRLLRHYRAESVQVQSGLWVFGATQRHDFTRLALPAQKIADIEVTLPHWQWRTALTVDMIAAALLDPSRMSLSDLRRYTAHLRQNAQATQRYQIFFWRKIFTPLTCLVMLALALPFAYLHFRSGGISAKVFAGVLLGISYVVFSEVLGHLGLLNLWPPFLVAAAPALLYLSASLAALAWIAHYR